MRINGIYGSFLDLEILDQYLLNDDDMPGRREFYFKDDDIVLATNIKIYNSKYGKVYYREIFLKSCIRFFTIFSYDAKDMLIELI